MASMRDLLRAADEELVDDARDLKTRAYRHDLPRVRDWTAVPCRDRASKVENLLDRLNEERGHIDFRLQQLTQKLRFRAADPRADVTPVVEAQDTLMLAKRRYSDLIKAARVVRKHTQRACRVKRR